MIRAESLTRSWQSGTESIVAVRELNLDVNQGERIAIVGRSGSGKSTLLNLVAGLDQPTAGSLHVDSVPLHSLTRKQIADYRLRTIGIVFQAFQLIPQRSARQNVELPLILQRVPANERTRLVDAALDRVGLADRDTHFPWQLSGGEQQRVAIARALINRPPLFLADEPTGNLDSATAGTIESLLLELCEEAGVTFILVTHDEPLAGRLATRTLQMADGQLTQV